MRQVNRFPSLSPMRAATLALVAMLSGCSTVENFLSGDKVDYRSAAAKTTPLDVPPDLTQLQRDSRYQPQGGVISANAMQGAAPGGAQAAASGGQAVAPQQVGDARVERNGSTRWLVTSQTPEQLWPQLRAFWQERGFELDRDEPEAGVMETRWAEDRSKLPQDFIRNTIGKVLNGLYDTGLRDKFRTRVERTPQGTEIYITHRGMEEIVTGAMKDSTIWRQRPNDPALEAEMLSRLMVKLGSKETEARAAVASAGAASAPGTAAAQPSAPARARVLAGQPAASLQLDDTFDRAWRRVGLSLDRSGFTVEDRDRASGVYFVRYADPKLAGQEEPNFFSRLFSGKKQPDALSRYRIQVLRGGGDTTTISVLNNQGTPDNGEIAQRIVSLLVDDLK